MIEPQITIDHDTLDQAAEVLRIYSFDLRLNLRTSRADELDALVEKIEAAIALAVSEIPSKIKINKEELAKEHPRLILYTNAKTVAIEATGTIVGKIDRFEMGEPGPVVYMTLKDGSKMVAYLNHPQGWHIDHFSPYHVFGHHVTGSQS